MNGKKKLLFLLLAVSLLFFSFTFKVLAETCDDIPSDKDNIGRKIACLQQKTQDLANQSRTLSNQIAQFNAQIYLTELRIEQTQEQIALLGGRIDQLEVSLKSLSEAFSSRAVATYKMARSGETLSLLLSSHNLTNTLEKFNYLLKAQMADHDLLVRLQGAQNTYKQNKTEQEKLQEQLDAQKRQLAVQKVAKDQLLASTQSDERKYQQLLSQAVAQRNAFLSFITRQGGASILNNQTVCDGWGCYYNQRDSQWGNNPMGTSQLSMAEYGCLVTSVSMMAKHYGRDIKPIDIANTPGAFFSPNADTALLYWSFSVNGVSVTLNPISVSQLDQQLASGNPVIAGLYGGPDHYIVIKSGSNGNYIMNDPYLENGGNRQFTEKYSVGNITRLFSVSFN
ncbi:MAG TPA: C39 family peptidase [Patescibacteria group bacterium]